MLFYYGGLFLPLVEMQDKYVNVQLIYFDIQHDYL